MYQENSLIKTKFIVPSVSSKLIKRPRLFKKLDAFFEYRLTLVVAPAGYGKTALITSWLAEKQRSAFIIAWLSLDEEDNDSECFWSYFIFSVYNKILDIDDIIDDIGEDVKTLYKRSASFNKLYLSHFLNIAAKVNREIFMVIDDFHVISDESIIENIKFFIKNMPSNMHILIISRSMPKIGLVRLRAADNVLEINQNDLCFTSEETDQFFNKISRTDFSFDKRDMIWNVTEGWAAGIQMMALSTRTSDPRSLEDHIYKDNYFIFDYMAEEVFSNLNDNIKKFLLYTSILNEFSCDICNCLLDVENSMEVINEIGASNLFLISLDSEHTWFRYHNLFKNFLIKQLNKLGTKVVYQLFDKAAKWYESKNQINKAVENYINAQNYKMAVLLIERVSGEILCRGEAKLLHKWNQMLPKNVVRSNSRLLMNSAWAVSSDGKPNEASEYIIMAQGCGHTHHGMKAEIVALSSTNITELSNLDKILDECKNIIQSSDSKEFLSQLIIFNMAKMYLLKGQPKEAVHCFEKCLSMSLESGEQYITLVANKALITWTKLRGEYRQAQQKCIELISVLKINGDIILPVTGVLQAELSDIYYQWNQLDKSVEIAQEGLKLGLEGENIWVLVENYWILSKAYSSMGMVKEYTDTVNKLEKYLQDYEFFNIKIKLESYNAETMIREKNITPVLKWLSDVEPLIKDDLMIIYPEVYIVKVRLYIWKNELDRAREILNALQNKIEKYRLNTLMIRVIILSSMIHEQCGDMGSAFRELEKAVELAWHQKLIRCFLDEGNWMHDMLKRLRRNITFDSKSDIAVFIDVILDAFNKNFNPCVVEKEEILSKREIEILKFIQQGATNSEISAELFVSINTVKTHILNIYTKLDVHNRTGAVAKAEDLGLI